MPSRATRRYAAAAAALAFTAAAAAADVVRKESAHPVKTTIDRLETALSGKGFKIFARVDHQAGAKSVEMDLKPMELIIFGNPAGGTPLIKAEPLMGLSLPLRALAWEDEAGKVWIGYDSPGDLAAARGLPPDHPAAVKIGEALGKLTDAAAMP